MSSDDERTVTVTVATLKAFEAAVRERFFALLARERAFAMLELQQSAYDKAVLDEQKAMDAEHAATNALYRDVR